MYSPKHVYGHLCVRRAFDDAQLVLGQYSARTAPRFRSTMISHPSYPIVLCETPFHVVEQVLFLTTNYRHADLKRRLNDPQDSIVQVLERLAHKFAARDPHPDGHRRYMFTANQVIMKVMLGQTLFLAVYIGPSYANFNKKARRKNRARGGGSGAGGASGASGAGKGRAGRSSGSGGGSGGGGATGSGAVVSDLESLQFKDTRTFYWRSVVESMTAFPRLLQGEVIPFPMALGGSAPAEPRPVQDQQGEQDQQPSVELARLISDKIRTPEFGESVVRHFSKFRQDMIDGHCAPETADGLVRVFFMDHQPIMFVTLHVVPKKVEVRKKNNMARTSLVHYEVRIRRDADTNENIFCGCPCVGSIA